MTTTTPEQPRRAKRVTLLDEWAALAWRAAAPAPAAVVTTPRRAVVEATPGPRSEGDPRHLAMTTHGTRRAER